MNKTWRTAVLCVLALCGRAEAPAAEPAAAPPLKARILANEAAYIPAQCYTRTQDADGRAHNPCYACHTQPWRPNFVNDASLQLAYDFAEIPRRNRWRNLFKDRRAAIAAIPDEAVLSHIRTSNYLDARGHIIPAERLGHVEPAWDYDGNGLWQGFVPDARFAFDAEGFDRDAQGRPTGWRAFAYYPFLGTFWPTNGSTDDVLIRLAPAFRNDVKGQPDLTVYKTNLAIVEALIRERDVAIEPVDEAALGGVDLDKDGRIGTARKIAYDWAPLRKRHMWYVGQALEEQRRGRVHLAAGLYPEGTEFLHTVRYIDVDAAGENRLSARMKEVRYARKRYWATYADLQNLALKEVKEKHDFPDRLRTVRGNIEAGVSNGQGWTYAGMIEDARGELRPQTYEELAFCVGCHGGIGANRDGIFSFQRKFDATAYRAGWYHWSQRGLRGTPERLRADGEPEYAYYLRQNGAGDELRANAEVTARFFDTAGRLRPERLAALRQDIAELLYASRERALALDKAYWLIVREQSFADGRDTTIAPSGNVHEVLDEGVRTGIAKPLAGF
ncbi:hypothetical protein EZJ19_13070 [Parasulfuritortus cantonensis]|uniref:Lipoprotein n=1 Tax=Parasulfuritortus cantonensis TaxID=2528202 RepID=A0A4R1B2J1_9PROT|nr:hypothetical protein [Parasulfuritortus cantonensis]TCJ12264.1 hypothetical protein EZJ19_13070 [Parasulfuritortus cantonensis]